MEMNCVARPLQAAAAACVKEPTLEFTDQTKNLNAFDFQRHKAIKLITRAAYDHRHNGIGRFRHRPGARNDTLTEKLQENMKAVVKKVSR